MVKGSDTTMDSCGENGDNKVHEENFDEGEDAASQTSNSKKRARLDNNDVIEMEQGLQEKFNVLFGKIKESGSYSGIEFTKKEINFVIVSWNVNGLGDPDKRFKLKGLVKRWKPTILMIQETKIKACTDAIVRQCWGTTPCIFTISISCRSLEDNFRWVLIGVYGPCHVNEKKTFRTELDTLHGYWNGNILCFGGAFNEIRYMVERRGCRRASISMKLFNDPCNELDLVELPLSNGKFTWSRTPNKKSKIDRFLFTPDWEDHFPNIIFKRLARPFSDHFPIELCSSNPDWGTAGDCFAKKLNALKEKLKVWNKDVFGSIDRVIDAALTKVKELDDLDDGRGLTEVEEDMLVTAKVEFEMAHRRQFIMLRKKSRIRYFRDGDRNTKHFQRVVKGHRAFNNINNLRINGR
ncbi:uncharacterized protein LOC113352097 [Papaver somniferum]|uniref:uncharacterized protein LOC113352097 n=1 Tax=Papaver somniferum TaxID=3469 RepID=UPI000E6FB159|nr:uncharacterized protein LOC113352097 [Papaver somniferum]